MNELYNTDITAKLITDTTTNITLNILHWTEYVVHKLCIETMPIYTLIDTFSFDIGYDVLYDTSLISSHMPTFHMTLDLDCLAW